MASTPRTMLKVVSGGLQDFERLNAPQGKPSLKFYTHVFRKRTRWASQWRRVEFDNRADFGRTATVTLPILGELITRAVLVVQLPDIFTLQKEAAHAAGQFSVYPQWQWTNSTGNALCSSVTFSCSDQIIDSLDSRLMEALDDTEAPVEHFDTTNTLLQRQWHAYPDTAPTVQAKTTALEVVFPFWWNRGIGPTALPIQALAKEKVQITCSFRPAQQLVYTDSRLKNGVTMPTLEGSSFYTDPTLETPIPDYSYPTALHFVNAYWIVEYVSLEEREAASFRLADLQIPFEQHVALPVVATHGAKDVRIRLERGGLVRDMLWVAQRKEATNYNAYFLFSKDLSPNDFANQQHIWWPDAAIPSWDYGDGYLRPAFCDRRSDPIEAAALYYRGKERFNFAGPSLFRSLVLVLGSKRVPLVNRYIYKWDFGFWPTGGIAETLHAARDEMRGAANWDKITGRELQLTMNRDDCGEQYWYPPPLFGEYTYIADVSDILVRLDKVVDLTKTDGLRINLVGAGGGGTLGGGGAYVSGIVDVDVIRRLPFFTGLWLRLNKGGSAAVFFSQGGLGTPPPYNYPRVTWLGVAAAGGQGLIAPGGHAGSGVAAGFRGVDGAQAHAATAGNEGGGGGGGRLQFQPGVEPPAGGQGTAAGTKMLTDFSFGRGHQQTGGVGLANGGDGYYGGGAGTSAGGGGGSYVGDYLRYVNTTPGSADTVGAISSAQIYPLQRHTIVPDYNIYVWLRRYNMLRIYGGRAALMFAE